MDQIYYRPDIELRTIVGTPMALETALTKLRGPVGDEVVGKLDYTQMKGGFDFDYAVYDEVCVHSLFLCVWGGEAGDVVLPGSLQEVPGVIGTYREIESRKYE